MPVDIITLIGGAVITETIFAWKGMGALFVDGSDVTDRVRAEERLLLFLEQYWGGPKTYSESRGHPRLRMRHMPFPVTPQARDRWLVHMMAGVDAAELSPEWDAALRDYLERAAHSLVNTMDDPSTPPSTLPTV